MTFTPEEITAMAKEANAYANRIAVKLKDWPGLRDARFATLVAEKAAAREREAAAQIVMEAGYRSNGTPAYEHIADRIRARGQKGGWL